MHSRMVGGKEWLLRFGVLTERKGANQVLHDTCIAACVVDANFRRHETSTLLVGEIPRHCLERVCFILSTVCAIGYYARRSSNYLVIHPLHRDCPNHRRHSRSVTEHKSRSNSTPAAIKAVTPFLETGNFSQLFLSPCQGEGRGFESRRPLG
jgi:hypothetical protein